MASVKSPSGIKSKTFAYENFQGLDTSRDVTSLDLAKTSTSAKSSTQPVAGAGKSFATIFTYSESNTRSTMAVRGKDEVLWVEQTGSGLTFRSDRDPVLEDVHPSTAIVRSTVFNQSVQLAHARLLSIGMTASAFSATNLTLNVLASVPSIKASCCCRHPR